MEVSTSVRRLFEVERSLSLRVASVPLRNYLAVLAGEVSIREYLTDSWFQLAVRVASPGFSELVAHHAEELEDSELLRRDATLLRYLGRLSSPPPPLGLFAGVTTATLGERTALTIAPLHMWSARLECDYDWLRELEKKTSSDRIAWNHSTYVKGGALFAYQNSNGVTTENQLATITLTKTVETISEITCVPILRETAVGSVSARLGTTEQAAREALDRLESAGLLSRVSPHPSAQDGMSVLEARPALSESVDRIVAPLREDAARSITSISKE